MKRSNANTPRGTEKILSKIIEAVAKIVPLAIFNDNAPPVDDSEYLPWPKVEDADVVAERTGKKHIGMWGMEAPGTFVLAMILFVTLVLYYFINFKYLSTIWGLS